MNEDCNKWKVKELAWERKYKKYHDDIVKYELYAQKQFSVYNTVVFFIYGIISYCWNRFLLNQSVTGSVLCMGVCLLSMMDYLICKTFLEKHIKYVTVMTNAYIVLLGLMLLSIHLIWNKEVRGGGVSWTLLVCSLLMTSIISIVPKHYAIALLCVVALNTVECIASRQGVAVVLDNLLEEILIFVFGVGMNVIYSRFKYIEFGRKEELQLENSRDMLTNLYNRRYIESYYDIYAKPENLCAIIMLDLDNFKMANDIYGHKRGDEVLCAVSDILRKSFRTEDCVARLGGDEFAVFLPKIYQKEAVEERVREVLDRFPIVVDDNSSVIVSVSIGVAYKHPGEDIEYTRLCDKADEAMYKAKKLGKGIAVISAGRNVKEAVIVA
jgi:diguanylate cyclase (GGDEF)-like protein